MTNNQQAAREWLPISSAPEVKGDYFWCLIAWGPADDMTTGEGFRWRGRWFAAASFQRPCQERRFEWREIEVKPTHWMPKPAAPGDDDSAVDDVLEHARLAEFHFSQWESSQCPGEKAHSLKYLRGEMEALRIAIAAAIAPPRPTQERSDECL